MDAGADMNATQSQRMTALMLAAKNGNVDVVRELSLRPGIKLDLREKLRPSRISNLICDLNLK